MIIKTYFLKNNLKKTCFLKKIYINIRKTLNTYININIRRSLLMKKIMLIIVFTIFMTMFSFSVSAQTIDLTEIENIVDKYDSGQLDVAQLIVYVNAHLKLEISKLGEDFRGFKKQEKNLILEKEGNKQKENEMIVYPTKDFDLLFEFYKGNSDYYSLIFGIAPSQKAIDNAIKDAEQEYVENIITEEQKNVDISKEVDELEDLESQKKELEDILADKEDEDVINDLLSQIQNVEEQMSYVKEQIDQKQEILDGQIGVDTSGFDVYEVNCNERYNQSIKIRYLLEDAIVSFPKWYFGEFRKGVDTYFRLSSGHEYLMHTIAENKNEINELKSCAYEKKNVGKINLNYDKETEMFKVWEEKDETYYQFYFLASKEMMKEIIQTKITDPTAKTTGYRLGGKDRFEKIVSLSEKYGGSFDAIIRIVDSKKDMLLNKHLTINPEVIISSKTVYDESEDVDIVLEIKYDKLYNYIKYISRDVEGNQKKNADWSKNKSTNDVKHVIGILSRGFDMWITGVSVKPIIEVPKLLFNLRLITEIFGD